MPESTQQKALQIRKYPNRRFYDATRSRHVTLKDVLAMVRAGHEVAINDSRSGTDITNSVLAQILLDTEATKLELLPSWLLHEFIRTDAESLRPLIERVLEASTPEWDVTSARVESLLGGPLAGPAPHTGDGPRLGEARAPRAGV